MLTIAGTSPQTYTYKDTSGNPQKITVSYNTYAIQTAFGCSGVSEANFPSTHSSTQSPTWGSVSTTNSRGTVLSTKTLTYGGGGAPANLLSSDSVTNANSVLASSISYSYDQTTPAASSGVPSHVSVTGSRGNLTTLQTYTSGSTSVQTSLTYEDTGSVLTSVDSINGTMQFNYDGTFTFNTGATLPTPSSGVSIIDTSSFDTGNTGLPWFITDPNGAVTKVASYNAMLQPLEVDLPDGGKTTWIYRNPNQTSIAGARDSSHSTDTETLLDGYGRVSRIAAGNGQSSNPWYQHDTCYDANGNTAFASYQYQGNGFGPAKVCSGAGDSYSYDMLGRVITVKHGDGTSVAYQYSGRATKITDENGASRITQVDGLGRTTAVCEISGSTLLGNAPGACGTDIAGTGFVTGYSYDLANHKTTVTQGVQTRVFQTDWIGRPILATEPERGTTTYAYSNNSTGLVVTRTRGRWGRNYTATNDPK